MTLLIRNVLILRGDGSPPEPGDVFISNDKISAIGNFPLKMADRIIEGQGAYLAPGFIDPHSKADHHFTILEDRGQADALQQGVTTVIGGQDGFSLAPWFGKNSELFYAWANSPRNIDWRTMREFLQVLRRQPLGVNFSTLLGWDALAGGIFPERRQLNSEEFKQLESLLERSLAEGALGVSVDLSSQRVPSLSGAQLNRVAQAVRSAKGVLSVDLRNSSEAALQEILKLARVTKVSLILGNLAAATSKSGWQRLLRDLEADGTDSVHVLLVPFSDRIRPLRDFLPEWALRSTRNDMHALLAEPSLRKKVYADLRILKPDLVRVVKAGRQTELLGLTLREVMAMYEIADSREALLKLMKITNFQALLSEEVAGPEHMRHALSSDRSLVGSGRVNLLHSRTPVFGYEAEPAFVRFLNLAIQKEILTPAAAIRKVTSLPAEIFGLKSRGVIRVGNCADLTLFKGNEIRTVIVNGMVAWSDARATGARAGKIISRSTH